MTYTVVCSADDRAAWLAARQTGIGASEVPALLGCTEWDSPLSIWERKTAAEPEPEREAAEHVRMGALLEPVILAEVARRAGVALVPGPQQLLRSTAHPWATATPDGMTEAGEPVEVKCLSAGYDPAAWAQGIPDRYLLQVHHQMLVTGATRALFGALVWGREIVWEWVHCDEMVIRRIIHAGAKLWRHIETRTPPESEGTPHDRRALSRLVDLSAGAVELSGDASREALEVYAAAGIELKAARARVRDLESEQARALDSLALLMGSAPAAVTPGGTRVEWVETQRKSYTVQASTSRSLRIVTPKEGK